MEYFLIDGKEIVSTITKSEIVERVRLLSLNHQMEFSKRTFDLVVDNILDHTTFRWEHFGFKHLPLSIVNDTIIRFAELEKKG